MKSPENYTVDQAANRSVSIRMLLWISLITGLVFFAFATPEKTWENLHNKLRLENNRGCAS